MDFISQRIERLAVSATLAMSQKSAELKAKGIDVINMSVGEPDFDTPHHIKEAAKRAVDENYSRYTPVPGYLSLRKAICEKLERENNISFTPEQIVVGAGVEYLQRRQAGALQRTSGHNQSRRRGDCPHACMGQLCGDGEARRGCDRRDPRRDRE